MNAQDFIEQVLTVATDRIHAVLGVKAAEYARGGDRLSNFKRAAAALGVSPERALLGMVMKHDVSIMDMIDDIDLGQHGTQETWEEKLFDSINYRILLYGLILERLAARPDAFGHAHDDRPADFRAVGMDEAGHGKEEA